jgi:hypothetical protein
MLERNASIGISFIPSHSGSFKLYILAGPQKPLAQHPEKEALAVLHP